MKRNVIEIALLLILAGALAAAHALMERHLPVSDSARASHDLISLESISASPQPTMWIDARSRPAYEAAHIPEALLLNEDEWEELLPQVLGNWHPGMRVIVYCGSAVCDASEQVARRLRSETGWQNVFVLEGGWQAWQQHHGK